MSNVIRLFCAHETPRRSRAELLLLWRLAGEALTDDQLARAVDALDQPAAARSFSPVRSSSTSTSSEIVSRGRAESARRARAARSASSDGTD